MRVALLASSALGATAFPALAQDATWALNPGIAGPTAGTFDFNASANWSPTGVPTGVATFDLSSQTAISFSALSTTLGSFTFNASAPAYTFNLGSCVGLSCTLPNLILTNGITNNSANAPTFNFVSTISGFPTLTIQNGSAANANFAFNAQGAQLIFQNSSDAGTAVITMPVKTESGEIIFQDSSSAANATISTVRSIGQLYPNLLFLDSSTAGAAIITNNPGTKDGGQTQFGIFGGSDVANAGTAFITNNNRGATTFFAMTSAANATIVDNSGGSTSFRDQSTAGSASITNKQGGFLLFGDQSSAGFANIVNRGQMVFGLGYTGIDFGDTASAGNAIIANKATGELGFYDSTTAGNSQITNDGILEFFQNSRAGHASITNNNLIEFADFSSAGHATITNNPGSLSFVDGSTAGHATITVGQNGVVSFADFSTAGNATITADHFGLVQFFGFSNGGHAQFIAKANGIIDFSQTLGPHGNGRVFAGSIAGNGLFFLGDNELVVGSNNLSTTVGGVIAGCGCGGGVLTKVGTGTLTLAGINDYFGPTTVKNGVLNVTGSIDSSVYTQVNYGAVLMGTGTVSNAFIFGTFMPGDGTPGTSMVVNGALALSPGATYAVNLNPTTSSFAQVAGPAVLDGTVAATWAPGSYIAKQYTILDAASISGAFAGLLNFNLPANFIDPLSYDLTHAYLNLILFTPAGVNQNQQSVSNGLINSFNFNSGIPGVFGGLTPNGLSQLSGEVGAGFLQAALQAGNSFLNLMIDPYFAGAFGTGTGFAPIPYAEEPHLATDAFASVDRKPASIGSRFGFWGAAYGGSGSISGNAQVGSQNYTDQIFAFASGLDYRLTADSTIGFALAGGGTHWGLDNALGSGRSDMFQAGVYGRTHWGPLYFSGAASYSLHDVSTDRTVTVSGTDVLHADFRANVFGLRLESGYRFVTPWAGIAPYGALQLQTMVLPAYGENVVSGSNQFALNYVAQTTTAERAELGARFDKAFLLGGGVMTLYTRAAWAHDFNNTASATALFQTLPGSSFVVNAATPAPDGALISAGAEYVLTNGWSVLGRFDGEFSGTTALYAGTAKLRKVW